MIYVTASKVDGWYEILILYYEILKIMNFVWIGKAGKKIKPISSVTSIIYPKTFFLLCLFYILLLIVQSLF